jgi:hypothetical protein
VKPWQRAAAFTGVSVVLGAVFASYLNPHLALELANLVWACF